MTAKAVKRRKQRRKEFEKEIQSFFERQNDGTQSMLAVQKDSELFTVDTTGSTVPNSTTKIASQQPLTQRPARNTNRIQKGMVVKKKVKSKAAKRKEKLDRVFDTWEESKMKNGEVNLRKRIPKLGVGERPHLAALPIDLPGCSFNPDPLQHEEALAVKKMEEARKQKPQIPIAVKTEIPDNKQKSPAEEEFTDGIVYRPKIRERKTKAQRNKEARHRGLLQEIALRKETKKLNSQINNIKAIDKEITTDLEQKHKNNLLRKIKRDNKMRRGIKKIGKKVIRGSGTRVLGADQLASSLRALHVSNDLALDRYVSLQKRGLLDAGRFKGRRNHRRYKYSLPGGKQRRIEQSQKEIPVLQKKVQDLYNQLEHMKMTEHRDSK